MRLLTLRPDRVHLAVAALVPFALDILLTSLGQPAGYWAGRYDMVIEANPVAAALLAVHPGLFLGGAAVYAALFAGAIYRCPRPVAWWLSVALLLAHAGGARSWLWHFTAHYTVWDGVLNGSLAVLAARCYLRASGPAGRGAGSVPGPPAS